MTKTNGFISRLFGSLFGRAAKAEPSVAGRYPRPKKVVVGEEMALAARSKGSCACTSCADMTTFVRPERGAKSVDLKAAKTKASAAKPKTKAAAKPAAKPAKPAPKAKPKTTAKPKKK
ncbi:hypothetical protein FACS1894186_3420 [Alphaproteobacteria bacterium]|nr:hypothetical protein FACS1894186_3420 [Alphaproteobacteria bacterium]